MLVKRFVKGACVLLLDGVDEAIRRAPWILHAMKSLGHRFPKVQVITSSRVSGSYLEALPYLAVTLLPFTDEQRDRFIHSWFHSGEATHVARIMQHLGSNPSVGELVRNPLLATVMCVLEEHSISLPDSEYRLYEERFHLLLGQYDLHKGVSRIRSHRHDLELMCRRLAFHLHSKLRKDNALDTLRADVTQVVQDTLDAVCVEQALGELIDPCNVLVPMNAEGKIGFGHLRYQEYLAAKHICAERSVDIAGVTTQAWWRGVFVCVAQMS